MKSKIDQRTATIVWYLITKLNGILGKTHLQKMVFLTDLLSAKRFKRQLTVMNYKKYHYGPYAEELGVYIDFLIKKGLIEEKKIPFVSNPSKEYSRFYVKKPLVNRKFMLEKIGSSDKLLLIEEIIDSIGNLSLQEVLDIVYSLQETKSASFNKTIEIAKNMKKDEEDIEAPF